MELKTGYKQSEVGVIPSDWDVKRLGELGKFSKGSGVRKDESLSGDIPCVRYGELYTRHSDYIKQFYSFISKEVSETAKKLKTGDILFAGSGETKEEIGKSVAFIDEFDAYAGGDIVILTPTNAEPLYLGYLLNAPIIQRQKASRGQGDAVVHISASQLAIISIPLPPNKAEQTAIATALSDTDQYITHLEKLIAKKRNIKQGAMQELLKPKEGWVVKKLGEIANQRIKWSFTGGPFGSNLKSSDYIDDGVRIIQLQNIGDGKFINDYEVYTSEVKADELVSCNILPGDILLSKMGDPVGRACIVPPFHSRYLMCSDGIRLVVDEKQHNTYFIYVSINFPVFRRLIENASSGSTRKRIGLSHLRNLELLVPKLEEQTRIASILSDMYAEINTLETKLSKAQSIKQGMMQQLLTGKTRLI